MARPLLFRFTERDEAMKEPTKYFLTDEDLRYEFHVMTRWCRLFSKTPMDWVEIEAKRFRDRHPVVGVDPSLSHAA